MTGRVGEASGKGLVRLASAGAVLSGVAFAPLVLVALGQVGPDDARLAVVASTVLVLLHLRHLRHAVRDTRPRGAHWSLVAVAAVTLAATPVLGRAWLFMYHIVAGSTLVVLRGRAAVVGFLTCAAAVVTWALRLGAGGEEAAWWAFSVTTRGFAPVVLVWMVVALRRLSATRQALADQAVKLERRRMDDECRRSIDRELRLLVVEAEGAARLAGARLPLEARLQTLVDRSRRTLTTTRRLVRRQAGPHRVATPPVPLRWWTPRRSRWLLVGMTVPVVAISPLNTLLGLEGRAAGAPWVVVPLAVAIGALQLGHSFAATRDERPLGWPWALLALGLLVYVPLPWFTWSWGGNQICLVASAALHLPRRARALAAAPLVVTVVVVLLAADVTASLYWLVSLVLFASMLAGTACLVRALDEIHVARTELAERAVDQERSRLSRDLHDALGQSLTAIALKGDLALALLADDDRAAAEAEIRSLATIARDALRDTRRVTHGRHAVSLDDEVHRGRHLLEAAGAEVRVDVATTGWSTATEEVLAWSVREAVTNMVRHSIVRRCSLVVARRDGVVQLEVVNDGAGPSDGHGDGTGRGLAGLAARAEGLGGSVCTESGDDGRFVLRVEVPDAHDRAPVRQ